MKTPDTEGGCCKGCKTATNKSEWDKGNVYCSNRECKCHTPDTEEREENEHGNTPKEQFVSDYDEHEDKENDMNLTGKDMQKLYALLGEFEDKIISSRDTYWKERVRKEIEKLIDANDDGMWAGREALDTLLDNLK